MKLMPWKRRTDGVVPVVEDFFDRFFDEPRYGSRLPEVFRQTPLPAVNVCETEGEYTITMDAPGLEEGDFEIQVMGNHLQIAGERRWQEDEKEEDFHRVESQYGRFSRTVELPTNLALEPDQVDAKYQKGVLKVSIPKREKTPTTRIEVHAG